MKKPINLPATFISIIILVTSCTKTSDKNPSPGDICTTISAKFTADVHPIISTSCAAHPGCHGAGSNNSGGPLTDYNFIFAKRSNIKFQVENALMPKGGSLTADQKNKIICWINSGAPNN